MSSPKTKIILALFCIIVALAFVGGIFTHRAFSTPETFPPDTVTVFREVFIEKPVPVKVEPAPASIPSVTVKKEDLLPSADTTSVQLRPQVSTFTDTLPSGASYHIQASGIGTTLDNISIAWPEKTTVKTLPYKGWSVNLVGQGIVTNFTKEGVSGFAGLEVGYTNNRFSFGIGPGALWSRPPGADSHKTSLAVMATVKVQLFRF